MGPKHQGDTAASRTLVSGDQLQRLSLWGLLFRKPARSEPDQYGIVSSHGRADLSEESQYEQQCGFRQNAAAQHAGEFGDCTCYGQLRTRVAGIGG